MYLPLAPQLTQNCGNVFLGPNQNVYEKSEIFFVGWNQDMFKPQIASSGFEREVACIDRLRFSARYRVRKPQTDNTNASDDTWASCNAGYG